jgi:hypothetical protein
MYAPLHHPPLAIQPIRAPVLPSVEVLGELCPTHHLDDGSNGYMMVGGVSNGHMMVDGIQRIYDGGGGVQVQKVTAAS